MKLIKYAFYFIIMASIPFSLAARDTSSGCGLGWEVNDDKSFLGTTTRGTTHSTLNPSFSMTSGTSGCDRHSVVKNDKKAIHFAEANFANLMIEMPMGNGEFLSGFARVLGCGGALDTFERVMQENYENIYSYEEITPFEMYDNVIEQIMENDELSSSCQVI